MQKLKQKKYGKNIKKQRKRTCLQWLRYKWNACRKFQNAVFWATIEYINIQLQELKAKKAGSKFVCRYLLNGVSVRGLEMVTFHNLHQDYRIWMQIYLFHKVTCHYATYAYIFDTHPFKIIGLKLLIFYFSETISNLIYHCRITEY